MRAALPRVAGWFLLSALSYASVPAERAWDSALAALRSCKGSWREVPALQETLSSLGPSVSSGLFGLLVADELPAEAGPGAQPLGPARALAITMTLELLPRESLRALLDEVAAGTHEDPPRLRSLELLAKLGSASDLGRATRLASGGTGAPPSAALQAAYRQAVTAILEREPGALVRFARELPELTPLLRSAAAEALSSLRSRAAFEALAGALGRRADADAVFLLGLGRIGSNLVAPPSERALASIRASLQSDDSTVATLAAHLARIEADAGAIPDLIGMLALRESGAREAARAALRSLARVDLGPDAEGWEQWYEAQIRWASQEKEAASRALQQGTIAEATHAAQQLAACFVLGEVAVNALLPGLERGESSVVELVCAALGRIEQWSAVPKLIAILEHPDPATREVACTALRQITKLELPPDAETWRFRIANLE